VAPAARALTWPRFGALAAATLAVVVFLGWANPIAALAGATFKAGNSTETQAVKRDPRHHDLENRSQLPRPEAGKKLIVFIAPSQQFSASLPEGARPDSSREVPVSSDLFLQKLEERAPGVYTAYNVGAPNQTFVEALWRSLYWFKLGHRPHALILQAAFDGFRKVGVRPEFQELLAQPAFADIEAEFERTSTGSYRMQFASARQEFEQRRLEVSSENGAEALLRRGLGHLPLYQTRETTRADLLGLLYSARVKFLGIKPTSKRHIVGAPVASNLDALRDLLRLARSYGTRVYVYNGPVNPKLSMFYEDEYRATVDAVRAAALDASGEFLDLGGAVPEGEWGYWMGGPDPIHFAEQGHFTVARRLDEAWGTSFVP